MTYRVILTISILTAACSHNEPTQRSPDQRAQITPDDPAIKQRLDDLAHVEHAQNLPERARDSALAAAYADLARAAVPLDHVSNRDLALVFDAAYRKASYTHDAATVRDVVMLLDTMQKHGIATDEHRKHTYETFVGARMFAEAQAFATQYPSLDLEELPNLYETELVQGRPTELVVDPSKPIMLRTSVDLQPAQVVIVSHPKSGSSQDAMRYIKVDPVLRRAFSGHTTLLAPQANHLDFDVIQQWNRDHPEMPHAISNRNSEWPMIDSWGTPTFYFFKDGAVHAKVEGWSGDESRARVIEALRQVGLL